MSNNLTPSTSEEGNREEHQIQTININYRKDNNAFNSSEIYHILLSFHTAFSLVAELVILLYHCPCH